MQKTFKRIMSLLCVSLLLLCGQNAYAQQRTVKGTVTDAQGEPLIGVTISVKGTTTGAMTDIDGNYSIPVAADAKTLVATFVGMKTNEQAISGNQVNFTMEDIASELDEVVVIGYGTARKRDLTGPVSSVGEKVLKDIPVATAAEAITGKLPGVQVTTTEGSPDAEIKIRVRGGGSITQSNTPLYIVDGMQTNSIADIAPSEIQSIDVLKDASTAAIYGSRGANGVVIITTKGAKEGKFSVTYNAYLGYKKNAKKLDVLSPYQFAFKQYERAVLGGGKKVADEYEPYFGTFQDIDIYKTANGTDWQDVVFGDTGTTFSHSVSVSGGSSQVNYTANYNRIDDEAIMMGSNYERDNFSAKLNVEPKKWLKFNFGIRYSDTKVKGGGANDVTGSEKSTSDSRLKNAVIYTPIPLKNMTAEDDEAESSSALYPPTTTIADNDREKKNKIFNLNGGISIKPMKGLTLRSEISSESRIGEDYRFYGLTTYYVTSGNAKIKDQPAIETKNTDYNSFRNTNTVTYDFGKLLGKDHNLTLLGGHEMIKTKNKFLNTEVQGFPVDFDSHMAWKFTTQGKAVSVNNFYATPDNLLSFFTRATYDFKGRYLFSASFRADGSSKFAKGNQWGYFPSVSGAWRISDESFMEDTHGWLSNLKLRASMGAAGNNNIGTDMFKQVYTSWSTSYIPESLSSNIWSTETLDESGNKVSIMTNPKLKWETTITRNIGLDYGFWNNRINGSIEFYKNNTKDLLINYPTSGTGYASQMRNVGETSNRGLEFSIDALLVDTKDFSLNAGFNISFNKNKVESLGGVASLTGNEAWTSMTEGSNSYKVTVGNAIGQMYGYVTDGMYTTEDFTWDGSKWVANPGVVDNSGITGLTWGPGALKLKDLNNSGSIDDGDRTKIGDANPDAFGAFNIGATYKGFDLSANFTYVIGNDIYNANKIEFTSQYYRYRNQIDVGTTYTQVDPTSGLRVTNAEALDALNANATMWASPTGRYAFHSWAVEDGSFLRLSSLTLGYTLPKSLTMKAGVQSLRFYVSGYNLYTWTNYTGYDPEVDTRRKTGLTPGVDYSAYPKSRSVNFGVNLTF